MNLARFAHLPDEAQLWVYGFASPLDTPEQELVLEALGRFSGGWVSHSNPVYSGYDIVWDRFVILAAHVPQGISGCSIDGSVRLFKHLRDTHGLDGLNRSLVFFRNHHGEIRSAGPEEFRSAVGTGAITRETPVFDTTIQSLGDLRSGHFEKVFSESWHSRSFSQEACR